jgi:signal transduction histidine kinase
MSGDSRLVRARGMIGLGLLLLLALYLTSLYSFLLFHTVVELFTIVVCGGVFMVAWNARAYMNNNYLLFVAIALVFLAILDVLHTVSYPGMGVFPGSTANLTTQLWIAGRYMSCVTWIAAPFLIGRKLRPGLQFATYGAVTAVLVWSIFISRIFPATYIDGVGLTPFKKISEYVISLLFVGAIALLIRKRAEFEPGVVRLLVASLVFRVSAEITFTTYLDVYSAASMLGHLLRWTAYFLLYMGIIETALVNPYSILLRDLKRSEHRLRVSASQLKAQNEDLARNAIRLREDAEALRERTQELDSYAHSVAHDLKNPLAVIVAAVDVINHVGNLSRGEVRDYLGQIKETAFGMADIIDTLLLLSEVRKGEVPSEAIDMGEVVARVEARMRPLLEKHKASLVFPSKWPAAMGYAPWIQEVWANYISNALKYGGPSPRIELGFCPAPRGMIRFWTRDYGPGISADAATSLFIPFRQLRSKTGEGHGLGLSIVLRIVEKLGGAVGAENADGKGALFYFTLREAPVIGRAADQAAEPAPGAAMAGTGVLGTGEG